MSDFGMNSYMTARFFLTMICTIETNDSERLEAAKDLPDTIQTCRDELVFDQEKLSAQYSRVRSLIEEVNEVNIVFYSRDIS